MQSNLKCAKCNHGKLLVVDELHYRAEAGHVNPVLVYAHYAPPKYEGRFQVIICTRCGYTEWWAHHIDELLKDISKFHPRARLVDSDPPSPYR